MPARGRCDRTAVNELASAIDLANALRTTPSLEEALTRAADALRAVARADGVAIVLDHEWRRLRIVSCKLAEHARTHALEDGDVHAAVTFSGAADSLDTSALAAVVGLALAVRFLGETSQFDALTGVLNRRAFDARLHEEWVRAARRRSSPTIPPRRSRSPMISRA